MKKYLKFAFVTAVAAIAGYGAYASQKADVLSDLMLANVEALASVEARASYEPGNECSGYIRYISICKELGW